MIVKKTWTVDPDYANKYWKNVSEEAKLFVQKWLTKD